MKKILLSITACIALVAVVLVSCKKTETSPEEANHQALTKMAGMFRFTDFPKNDNGILVFRDQGHYDKYLGFLGQLTDSLSTGDSSLHALLQTVESGLGFTSIRRTSHDAYERQNAIGWRSLEEIPDEHFIIGADLRSTLTHP